MLLLNRIIRFLFTTIFLLTIYYLMFSKNCLLFTYIQFTGQHHNMTKLLILKKYLFTR